MNNKIAFFSEGGYSGKVSRDTPMRTDQAWICALNATHYCIFKLDEVNLYAYQTNFLSPKECEDIIKQGKSKKLEKGNTSNNNLNKTRKSNISWLSPNDNFELYRKLTDTILYLNKKYFGFDLYGFTEALQFTNYKAPGGKYDSHVDRCFGTLIRKLSVVILLSDDFEGGDFELISGDKPEKFDPNNEDGVNVFEK